MPKWEISLEQMEFFAYHGWYPEEREQGNIFWVDVAVSADLLGFIGEDDLENSINYELIYRAVKQQMNRPVKLLETLCENILTDLRASFGADIHGYICIRKKCPPSLGKTVASKVTRFF
jgi:7,8-dihydroneopterin aldolase/epimerase/oxygenase